MSAVNGSCRSASQILHQRHIRKLITILRLGPDKGDCAEHLSSGHEGCDDRGAEPKLTREACLFFIGCHAAQNLLEPGRVQFCLSGSKSADCAMENAGSE